MTRVNTTYNGDRSPMNNEQRSYIGRQLLSQYRITCNEPDVSNETVRDAIADILHAAVSDRIVAIGQLENTCKVCINHVKDELAEEQDALWEQVGDLDEKLIHFAEAGHTSGVARINEELRPLKMRMNILEGRQVYDVEVPA